MITLLMELLVIPGELQEVNIYKLIYFFCYFSLNNNDRNFKDVSVEAYSKNGNCLSPKITDQIATASNGRARTVSVSGSKKMAAAIGINTELAQQHPNWNSEAFYFHRQRVHLFETFLI